MTEENEKKKKYLMKFQYKAMAVKRLEEQIEELRKEKMYPSAVISDMPRGAGNQKDMSDYMAALDSLIARLVKAKYNRIKAYTEIQEKIDMLTDEVEQDVLYQKYIKGYSFERIADGLGYSWRQTIRIHGNALAHIKI